MKNILWVGLAVLVVVLGVWMLTGDDNDTDVDSTNNTASSTENNGTNTGTNTGTADGTNTGANINTPKSLLSVNGNFQCDFEQSNATMTSKNTIYVSKGKMRAEFRTKTGANTVATMVVYDGLNLYSWKEGMSTGTVTQPKNISEFTNLIPADVSSAAVLGTNPNNANYDCRPWITDQKILVKPTYVTFN